MFDTNEPDADDEEHSSGSTTRRDLLRSAAAGTVGAVPSAGAVVAQSDDVADQWEPYLGPGVDDVAVELFEVDDAVLEGEPAVEVAVEDETVVVQGYWEFDLTACQTIRPRGIEYDPALDLLALDLVEVPGSETADVDCLPAYAVGEFEVAVDLASDVDPGTVRVATSPDGAAAPDVYVATPGEEDLALPDAVVGSEFGTGPVEPPASEVEAAPRIGVEDGVVTISSQFVPRACTTFGPSRIELVEDGDDEVLEVAFHQHAAAGSPAGRTCDSDVWKWYWLDLEFEGGLPDRITAVETFDGAARRRTVDLDAAAGEGDPDVASYEFTATPAPDAEPLAEPVVRFGDDSAFARDPPISVEGVLETCDPAVRTLDLAELRTDQGDGTSNLVAGVVDRGLDRPPRYPEGTRCVDGGPTAYELTVDLEDAFPEAVSVAEHSPGIDRSTVVRREDRPLLVAPEAPRQVGATPDTLTLEWDPVPEADYYEVALDGERETTTADPRAHLEWLIPDGETYEVAVRARDAAGRTSAATTFEATTPPSRDEVRGFVAVEVQSDPTDELGVASVQLHGVASDAAVSGYSLRLEATNGVEIRDVDPPLWYEADDPDDREFLLTDLDLFRSGNNTDFVGTPAGEPVPVGDGPVELATVEYEGAVVANPLEVDSWHVVLEDVEEGLPALGDHEPRDLDGDGLYRDVTGDGDVGLADVDAFQSHLFEDAVQENAQYFDFAGSEGGTVGHGDVVALFGDVTGL